MKNEDPLNWHIDIVTLMWSHSVLSPSHCRCISVSISPADAENGHSVRVRAAELIKTGKCHEIEENERK